MRLLGAEDVRATIAMLVLGPIATPRLGAITLHAHQVAAVARLRSVIQEHGGALLADDVGLGKTYAGLGVAHGYRRVVVIAPAAVRAHWLACASRAAVAIAFHSMESLSHRGTPALEPDLVLIDEAHHFRTGTTRRFRAVRQLCANAHVLLMTATPVQNSDRDLRTMLSLFLGTHADTLSNADAARFIVRRMAQDLGAADARPDVAPPRWLPPVDDVDCLDRIVTLPSAVPPVDGRDGGALVYYTLLRQWASSRAALVAGLRRRVGRGLAMMDALRAGRLPSRAELAAWSLVEDAQQLFFPELLGYPAGSRACGLLSQIEAHVAGVRALLRQLEASSNPDEQRSAIMLSLQRQHSGERVIAFSEYGDTVSELFRRMAPVARVAMLTHSGARVASGPVNRAEILDRFAAGAGARAHLRDRIDLLITTDVLSEGVSLPDASVVVHLDLAWNPARLEQRIGRLRRLDSVHPSIAVYLMPPPAPAERMLRVEQRLRLKHALARRALDVAGSILPAGPTIVAATPAVRPSERLASVLQSWRRPIHAFGTGVVGAVRAPKNGAIACVRIDGSVRLLAVTAVHVTDAVVMVEQLTAAAGRVDVPVDPGIVDEICARVERFAAERHVSRVVHLTTMHVARTRRTLLRRADAIARRSSRETRARIAPLLHGVRAAASAPLSAGAERALDELAAADVPDDQWLRAINAFAATHTTPDAARRVEILALLILRAD